MIRAHLALSALLLAGTATMPLAAKEPSGALAPTPIGNPGDWLTPNDYPPAALFHEMAGVTAFRLTVDAQGHPTGCAITASSQFDVLDRATCERLLKNASFTPARDAGGRVAAGEYSSRVRWVIPNRQAVFQEGSYIQQLGIDAAGKVVSCQTVSEAGTSDKGERCRGLQELPRDLGLLMRGSVTDAVAEVTMEMTTAYGKAPALEPGAPVAGYEQEALYVFGFTANGEGKLTDCRFIEQRGAPLLINNFCRNARELRFDPPFAAIGPDGSVRGWARGRILARTAK